MMEFQLTPYQVPDFAALGLENAPDAQLVRVEKDRVAPDNYHATTIFPEYFKVNGKWCLAAESRMDCVAVWDGEAVQIREFRHLKTGDLVFTGRTEDGSEGIFVHTHGFENAQNGMNDTFAFRQSRFLFIFCFF